MYTIVYNLYVSMILTKCCLSLKKILNVRLLKSSVVKNIQLLTNSKTISKYIIFVKIKKAHALLPQYEKVHDGTVSKLMTY